MTKINQAVIKTLILARGGSKGIPRKNVIDVNGKPLIQYAIEAAKSSNANDVYVSTDCATIMLESIKHKAKVLMRPYNISLDDSKSEEALLHFADKIPFDILVFIQPTSPLVTPEDINAGLIMIKDYDSVFSAYKEHWLPRWTLKSQPSGWNANSRPMRQDIEAEYVENGAIYITTRQQLEQSRLRYSGNIGILEMPFARSFQVDSIGDLQLIRQLLKP